LVRLTPPSSTSWKWLADGLELSVSSLQSPASSLQSSGFRLKACGPRPGILHAALGARGLQPPGSTRQPASSLQPRAFRLQASAPSLQPSAFSLQPRASRNRLQPQAASRPAQGGYGSVAQTRHAGETPLRRSGLAPPRRFSDCRPRHARIRVGTTPASRHSVRDSGPRAFRLQELATSNQPYSARCWAPVYRAPSLEEPATSN
jgi:hypothetical protein